LRLLHSFPTRRSSDLSALVLEDDNGDVVAGLPVVRVARALLKARAISLPFTDNCAPLARDEDGLRGLARALANWHTRFPSPLPLDRKSTRLNSSHDQI